MTSRDKAIKKNHLEGMEIDRRISENHKYNDETAILRKEINRLATALYVPLSDEFEAYYAEAEAIKAEAKGN